MVQNPSSRRSHSRGHVGLAVAFLVALTTVATPIFEKPASAAARTKATKYEVCHRTNAIKNPYRRISVAWSSVDANGNGHDNPVHDGPVFNVADPVGTHGTTPRDSGLLTFAGGGNDRWGDIFNASRGSGNGNNNSNNWTTAGQAIFNGATFTIGSVTKAACKTMSAIDYIKSEREENPNKSMSTIMGELDDMEAADDAALKTSLGGSFSTWYTSCNQATTDCENTTVISSLVANETPSVTTETPSPVSTGSTTNAETATLKGTVSPLGVSMLWYFEFDDDANFTPDSGETLDVQEVPGTPGTTTSATTINVTYNATGLNATKTYYYRTVGVATSGSADTLVETYLYGVTRQFTYGAPLSPTIDSVMCGSTTLSVAFTAGSANGGTITNYEYSVNGGETFVPLGTPATTSPISITGLVNGTEYGVAIRAITSTKTGVESATTLATPCGTPSSTTTVATNVQPTTATINGHLTGNGNALASISFTWGTSNPPSGNTAAANTVTLPGTANAYPVLANLTGLTGGTTYYYEVSGTYASGASTTRGGILSFVTPANAVPPTVTTEAATNVAEQSATLNGTGTSNGASSTLSITWGTSPTLATGNTTEVPSQSPLSPSTSGASVTKDITGLTGGTTYYFRVSITNTNGSADGVILSFTTPTAVVPQAVTTTTTPSTTTTAPAPTTTTTAAPITVASVGAITGTVWIDTDGDEQKDLTEVWIPGITLSLTGTATGTATTNSNGSFSLAGLAVGSYKVRATLPNGLDLIKSWDSQGSNDWETDVTVVAGQTARADFAARGNLEAKGKIMSVSPGTAVNLDWSGVDKDLDTVDDVTFTATVKSDQTFELQNIPSGKFRVRAQSIRQVISVSTAGATFESPTISLIVRVPELPETGTSSLPSMITWALTMIPVGIIVIATSRRRRRV